MPENKVSKHYRIDPVIAGKLAYISWFDRKTEIAVVEAASQEHITKWEKKNGAITDDMIKKATTKK